jgi:2-hydroxymuconate-semialdehyde hydrolase
MSAYSKNSFEFEGAKASYLVGGAGFPILMIHGSGPGASTMGNWRLVLEPLAQRYRIFAMDLIGFGESGRRPKTPYFDVNFWLAQCKAMIDSIPGGDIGIIGHSVSGALALKLAASNQRVKKVLTTGSMGAHFKVNAATLRCWTAPKTRADLLELAKATIHDQRHVTDAWIAGREKVLFEDATYGPYFTAMFPRDRQEYVDDAVLSVEELSRIQCDVTMMHGRNDIPFPPSMSISIAEKIPQADLILLARCSHSVAVEYPDKLLAAAHLLFGSPAPEA